MQTITATAKQLGVTRQYLGQLVKQLPREQQPTQKGNARLLSDEAITTLAGLLSKPKTEPSNRTKADTEIIKTLRDQLEHERRSNEQLQTLLENEQKLHLIAEDRAEKLQNKLNLVEDTREATEPRNDATETPISDSKSSHDEIHPSQQKPLREQTTALRSINAKQPSFWAKFWQWVKS